MREFVTVKFKKNINKKGAMRFLNKYTVLMLLITGSTTTYGQSSHLVLSETENQFILQNISDHKNDDMITTFMKRAKTANIAMSKIDSLLIAKETYLYLQKRIEDDSKKSDALFLFSENKGTLKRENFNLYRKKLTAILSKEEFYNVYQDIIDAKSTLVTQQKINELKSDYRIDEESKKELLTIIEPICKDICLNIEYYSYDKKLLEYKKHLLEKDLEIAINEKLSAKGLLDEKSIFDSDDYKMQSFIETARASHISDSLIIEIAQRILVLDNQLKDSKKLQGVKKPNLLYTPYDKSLNSSDAYRNFERYITSVLSKSQYKLLFWKQFEPRIEKQATDNLEKLFTEYQLNDTSNRNKKLLKKWVYTYTTDAFIASQYYARESALVRIKVKRIERKARKKYEEIITKITKEPISKPSEREQRVLDFLVNAKTHGIDQDKAKMIAEACLEYELKQEEIAVLKKYDKSFIHNLENDNQKIRVRDTFKRYLKENLTKTEYQKLFWEQLASEVNDRVNGRFNKVKETYPKLNDIALQDIRKMIKNQTTKETVAKYYYSYDKKIAKQKVKALNYKFNKEYKEKIKQLSL